jgi:hypothetical protein
MRPTWILSVAGTDRHDDGARRYPEFSHSDSGARTQAPLTMPKTVAILSQLLLNAQRGGQRP